MSPMEAAAPLRVLLVMPEQWPRSLLRAALREAGYDAVGAPGLAAALHYPVEAPGRGPVRLILLDQAVLRGEQNAALFETLLERHRAAVPVLLARATTAHPRPGGAVTRPWGRVVTRPATIADLVAVVEALLPLPPDAVRPLD